MIRFLALGLIFTALLGCRTQKKVTSSLQVERDSLSVSNTCESIESLDSRLLTLDFSFDTLEVEIQRQDAAAPATSVKVKSVNGSLLRKSNQQDLAIKGYNRLDSVAFKSNSLTDSSTAAATTSIAEPPRTTLIIAACGLGLLVVLGWFVYLKKR